MNFCFQSVSNATSPALTCASTTISLLQSPISLHEFWNASEISFLGLQLTLVFMVCFLLLTRSSTTKSKFTSNSSPRRLQEGNEKLDCLSAAKLRTFRPPELLKVRQLNDSRRQLSPNIQGIDERRFLILVDSRKIYSCGFDGFQFVSNLWVGDKMEYVKSAWMNIDMQKFFNICVKGLVHVEIMYRFEECTTSWVMACILSSQMPDPH